MKSSMDKSWLSDFVPDGDIKKTADFAGGSVSKTALMELVRQLRQKAANASGRWATRMTLAEWHMIMPQIF